MKDRLLFEQRKNSIRDMIYDPDYIPLKLKEMAYLMDVPHKDRGALKEVMDALVRDGSVEMLGEHIIGDTSHLKRFKDFMGADEVMAECDIKESPDDWKAIVIITRKTEQEAVKAFNKFVDNIRLGGIYDKISA